ncbi:hypothetical protein [Leifsonia sp. 22587]|uniref:hypothetical protein n=1 Tax=Leifsonia sp. 22587 TaxID=3453946 RepID=UPI003F846D7F
MKLAKPAVIGLIALSLAGCTATADAPSRTANAHNSSAPAASTTPAVVDGLPSSCDAFFSSLKTFVSPDGSLVLNPAWKSGAGVARSEANGYGSYDPTLAPMLSQNPGLICDWAPAAGPSDTFLTTQFRHVDDATAQTAIAHLEQLNWGCSPVYDGMWCLTNDSHTGRSIGESQYFGHGDWIASDWNNAGPETYTPRLLETLFG